MNILNKETILEQAKAFINEGKLDRAISEYEKILLTDPSDLRVKLRIAELYAKRKQVNEAIKVYREVAQDYSEEGFFLKAVTVYKNILRLNPSLIEINQQLAKLYEKMELKEDAIHQYDIIANSYERKGEIERVCEICEKIVYLNPNDNTTRTRLAEMYQREGKAEDALDQYEEMAKQLEEEGGNETKRAELYEKILHHRPDRLKMFAELVKIYFSQAEHKKALHWLESSKDITPFDPDLLGMQAKSYAILNQLESSRNTYKLLAELYHEQGAIDQALLSYGEILVLMPEDEDYVKKQIEKLKPGAFPSIKKWVEEQREEIKAKAEAEEAKLDQQDSERQQAGKVEKKEQAGKVDVARQERLKKVQSELGNLKQDDKPAVSLAEAAAPVSAAPDPEPSESSLTYKVEELDSALQLFHAYQKMGLASEASAELNKADNCCIELCKGYPNDEGLQKKRLEINELLGKKTAEQVEKVVVKADPPKKAAKPQKTPVSQASTEPVSTPKKKKRKVSFV